MSYQVVVGQLRAGDFRRAAQGVLPTSCVNTAGGSCEGLIAARAAWRDATDMSCVRLSAIQVRANLPERLAFCRLAPRELHWNCD